MPMMQVLSRTSPSSPLKAGTQRILPRLAAIWRRSLVWMLWAPFLRRVFSTTNWLIISLPALRLRSSCLTLGQVLLRLPGSTIIRILILSSFLRAFSMPPMMSLSLNIGVSCFFTTRSSFSFLAVLSKVPIIPPTSACLVWRMVRLRPCLEEKRGCPKSWKKDSLFFSTDWPPPNSSLGFEIWQAWTLLICLLSPIPSYSSRPNSFLSPNSRMKLSISSCLSLGFRIVCSLIFLRLCSSKLSGMPVRLQSSGSRQLGPDLDPARSLLWILFSTSRRGWASCWTWMLQRRRQYSLRLGISSLMETSSMLLNSTSRTLQKVDLPQLVMTMASMRTFLSSLRFSSLSLPAWTLQTVLMASRTVSFLTILRAVSTRRNMPFSHSWKVELNPLNILRLSMFWVFSVVKYLPERPISTQLPLLMIPLRELLRNCRNTALLLRSQTFLCRMVTVQGPVATSKDPGHSSDEKTQNFLQTGFLIFAATWLLTPSQILCSSLSFLASTVGMMRKSKMTTLLIPFRLASKKLDVISTALNLLVYAPRCLGGIWQARTGQAYIL